MWRRLRWFLLALVVLVVGGAVTLAVVERPKLDDGRSAVDARWNALRPALRERYDKLGAAVTAFSAAGGGDRAVTQDIGVALGAWAKATAAKDPGTEAAAANRLEAQATRLRVNAGVGRLAGIPELSAAIGAFTGSTVPPDRVRAYNRAVTRYQTERRSTLGAPVARVLGFGERPVLVLGG
jgi:hypothetical protein